MEEQNGFMLNLSILYRNTQKYFDHMLAQYDIGAGQYFFLIYINEHEGTTMMDVTNATQVDKGTTTKAIGRLINQGYVQVVIDEKDKRVKRLYTTDKVSEIIDVIYECRNKCRAALAEGTDFNTFESLLNDITKHSSTRLGVSEEDYTNLRIGGLQKMTLLDYPEKVACTIFMAGCNLKCPFCHNRDLVYLPEDFEYYNPDDVLAYLEKRKGLLDAICITGGEPLLQKNLNFIQNVKDMGYLIKIDTNGTRPDHLKEHIETGLIDYVAMDIKNSPKKYAETVGMDETSFSIENIEKSIAYLKENHVDYEFRTTVVKELHTAEDLVTIAKWIAPTKKYYLQQFQPSENTIQDGFTSYNKQEMEDLLEQVQTIIPTAQCRGVKEN